MVALKNSSGVYDLFTEIYSIYPGVKMSLEKLSGLSFLYSPTS